MLLWAQPPTQAQNIFSILDNTCDATNLRTSNVYLATKSREFTLRNFIHTMEAMITVSDWCFCKTHGLEFCHYCCCDYRTLNDMQIEEYAEKNIDEDDQFEVWENLDVRRRLFSANILPRN